MGIFDGIKRQLRSVIQWENPNPAALFQLWSEDGDEIKNASKLIVKPGQGVIFVYEGKIQAVHQSEGLYELSTANIPFITTITKFMQAFVSEHKVGIYFFWRTEQLNQKWGTTAPVKYNDPVYKFPVGLRAFGNYSFKIDKAENFFVNVVGGRQVFMIDDVRTVLSARIVQPLTDLMAESGYSYAEVDRHRDELSAALKAKLEPDFVQLGFAFTDFRIENTDFDEATQGRIAKIADAMADSQAAQAAGLNYAQMQQLGALRDAARNEGGAAGAGIGIGAGVGLGQMFAAGMVGQGGIGGAGGQPGDPAERLKKLKEMLDSKLISQEEFEKKKADILGSL